MKKLLAVILCAMLLCTALPGLAENAPWLAPLFTFADEMTTSAEITRAEIRVSLDVFEENFFNEMESLGSSDPELEDIFRSMTLRMNAISKATFDAESLLLSATVLTVEASNGRYYAALLVDGKTIADAEMRIEPDGENLRITALTSLLPSLAFVASIKKTDAPHAGDTELGRAFEALLALSKEGDGLTILSDGLKAERANAEYILGEKGYAALDAEEYRALLANRPDFYEGSLAVLKQLLESYADKLPKDDEVPDGARYQAEKIGEDAFASALNYMEESADGAADDGGQTRSLVTRMHTLSGKTYAFSEYGHADAMKNGRVYIDLSAPDAPRVAFDFRGAQGTVDLARDAQAQTMAIYLLEGNSSMNGAARIDNEGRALTADVEFNFGEIQKLGFAVTAARLKEVAQSDALPLEGRTVITPIIDELSGISFSEADEKLIKNELYNVTRPRLIHFALAELPKGAEAISMTLLGAFSLIGR